MLESKGTEVHNKTCKNIGTKVVQSRKQERLNNMLFNATKITLYYKNSFQYNNLFYIGWSGFARFFITSQRETNKLLPNCYKNVCLGLI